MYCFTWIACCRLLWDSSCGRNETTLGGAQCPDYDNSWDIAPASDLHGGDYDSAEGGDLGDSSGVDESSSEEEEGMCGYRHQQVPWKGVQAHVAAATVGSEEVACHGLDRRSESGRTTAAPRPADSLVVATSSTIHSYTNTSPGITMENEQLSRSEVSFPYPSAEGLPSSRKESNSSPIVPYYASLVESSEHIHVDVLDVDSMYAPVMVESEEPAHSAKEANAFSPRSSRLESGQRDKVRSPEGSPRSQGTCPPEDPPDIPDEAFLALFEELERGAQKPEQRTGGDSTRTGEKDATKVPTRSMNLGPNARDTLPPMTQDDAVNYMTTSAMAMVSSTSPTQQGLSTLPTMISPYLKPYTPSKRTTPGRYLYLPQLVTSSVDVESCGRAFRSPCAGSVLQELASRTTAVAPTTPTSTPAADPATMTSVPRQAFAWKHIADPSNCVEFLSHLRSARCVSFDLVFAAPPVCKDMPAAAVHKAWLPVVAYSPSSSSQSVPLPAKSTYMSYHIAPVNAKSQHQVLVGIALCFGGDCAYYLPLPVMPPLLRRTDETGNDEITLERRGMYDIMPRLQHKPTSVSISLLPAPAKGLICRYVGFGSIVNKCPMLRTCLADVKVPERAVAPSPHVRYCPQNPLMAANKSWAALCRTALRVEWAKGNCVEWRLCGELMSSRSVTKIAENIKDKMLCLRERDIIVNGAIEDPQVALSLLECNTQLSLPIPTVSRLPQGVKPTFIAAIRACYISIAIFRAMADIEVRLRKHGLEDTFFNMEMPLCHTVVDAELNGLPLNTSFLSNLRQDVNDRIKIIEHCFRSVKGPAFNIASPQDVAALKAQLEQKMKQREANHQAKEKLTKPSFCSASATVANTSPASSTLHAGSLWSSGKENEHGRNSPFATAPTIEDHPLLLLVKEHRSHSRIIPTLTSILSSRYRPAGHSYDRVRATFHTIGTETGRLIVTSPPLQQVPHECKYLPPMRPNIHQEIMQARDISVGTMENVIASANRKALSGHMEWVRLASLQRPTLQAVDQSMSMVDVSMVSDNGMYISNGMAVRSAYHHLTGKLVRILDKFIDEPVTCPESGAMIHLLDIWRDAGFVYTSDTARSVRIVEVSLSRRRYFYPADQVCRLLAPVMPDTGESEFMSASMATTGVCASNRIPTSPSPASSVPPVSVNPRDGFKSRKGYVLLTSDYSQIELRILAHFAMDAKLCAAFDDPQGDIFASIAAQWANKPVSTIDKAERDRVKQVCYALLYGAGPAKVAANAGCSVAEAESMMNGFMACYPGIKKFMNQVG